MPDLSQKLAAAEARARALERRRTEADCRFAGRYAEMSGSHCPIGDPCQRCQLEAAEARVAELEAALRWIEIHEAFHYANDREWAVALKAAARRALAKGEDRE